MASRLGTSSIEESSVRRAAERHAVASRDERTDDGRRRLEDALLRGRVSNGSDGSLVRVRCARWDTMNFWRSKNRVYGLAVRRSRRPGPRGREKRERRLEEWHLTRRDEGSRRCLRQHVLWAWSNAKEIYCLARVFMAYLRVSRGRNIYTYIYLHRVQRGMREQVE